MGNKQALVLIDSGATHNFIDYRLMEELGLEREETESFGVITGSGKAVKGGCICRKVKLEMQSHSVTTDFLPFELNNVDIILGIQWLETLGEMRDNWKLQTLKILVNGEWVKLQGEPDICCSEVSAKAIRKALEQQELSVVVECRELTTGPKEETKTPKLFKQLLLNYEKIFEEPQGLPPTRSREHAITLTQGSDPVSVRPFRYPHPQKEEIEKQVTAMLKVASYRRALVHSRVQSSS